MIPMGDMVNSHQKVQAFGIGLYSCPSNEMLMKKVPFGPSKREKSLSYCENIMKKKAWVPGPTNYTAYNNDWSKMRHEKSGAFLKDKKITCTEEIFVKGKTKEKTSPGVGKYEIEKSWKNSSLKPAHKTTYKYKDKKISFTQENINMYGHLPAANKYDAINLEKYKTSTHTFKISTTDMPRFKKVEKTLAPSPSSYNTAQALDSTQNKSISKSKFTFNKTKRISFLEEKVKRNTSPGAG